ncbi:hypothetical protein R6Q59_004338 [Mikania micrantha]|uniref:F-box domain-containing protein n=1 Tax=Mikania micrantha TaxID=192012 RepID=A0A5N6MNS9_9ASTR|nr:hypothetical protein E3N88_31012 [Mikania micrantha]
MDSGNSKIMRMNANGDRLSSLPDDLIHKILSCFNIREAIGTSVLSSRWRFIWTSMPYLSFSTRDFSTLPKFSKFVTNVLYRRNNQAQVYSMKLLLRVNVSLLFVKRLLDYAFSHNIQQLNAVCILEKDIEFPLSLFSSQSLKHLSLTMQAGRFCGYGAKNYLTSNWEITTLTTLDLHSVILCDAEGGECIDVFSKCENLENLTLRKFNTKGSNGFSIVHPRLSSLTLEDSCYQVRHINVTAPQLKNLTISSCSAEHVISAPDLASLFYKNSRDLHLSTEGFHSLEKADICISNPPKANADQIVCLLQYIHNVHFLRLNLEIVELLFSSVELLLHQPFSIVNLKRLKIYPEIVCQSEQASKKAIMFNELQSFLLDNFPGSTISLVLREEIKAKDVMAELRMILENEKDNSNTNPKLKIEGNMVLIKSCWKNLGVQIEKASVIMSKLQDVEDLLTKLPASKRAKIQPCFSNLCAEAHIAISKITDGMKIQCDENQSLSSACFQMNLLQHWSCFLSKLSVPDFPYTHK